MSYLSLNNLSRHFGDFTAVDNLNLDVSKGEFISLLGPSGCGKTTTLQMIAGFLEPSSGQILLDGEDITRKKASERQLGIVFQKYALFPHMTVAENVAFGLEMRKVAKDETRIRVREALELVQLDHLAARYPKQLSGGQQQRVALARALVIRPPLLLLDEPLSNLDAKLREEMQLELHKIQRTVGTTTILVTHDQAEALALSDRVVVLQQGKIEQIDSPFNVYEYPQTRFVSSFLGKANQLQGQVGRIDAQHAEVELDGQALLTNGDNLSAGQQVHLSLRPEKVRFVARGEGQLDGVVSNRVFLGNQWIYEVDTRLGEFLVFETNHNHREGAREGDRVGLTWDPVDLRVIQEAV
ncbi:ABC transporter ATP-binding protein [Marinobacterium arenosum]|uniref:ABC transporter ATP-binding protein n=1 Tax=Marinobacterium arenosum TaxID=2862496 RepID=UPI001C97D334|nr:ABC transporter ATP-binding protein [Marinobacterium arenosum]MBY4676173.1 ABC transporter ATP-binding protein [Marinobacterium arenosum]